jgi:LAS superfamily LD-carboxypeptidase LdcB
MFQVPRKKGPRRLFFAGILTVVIIITGAIFFGVWRVKHSLDNLAPKHERRAEKKEQVKQDLVEQNLAPLYGVVVESQKYIQLTGEDFKNLYDNYQYEHVGSIAVAPEITGNVQADIQIRTIAESRGYKLRPEATEVYLKSTLGQKLQSKAKDDFLRLQTAGNEALESEIILASGYRSIERQREIFLNSIADISVVKIISGEADQEINNILITRSIPGYSKHHTGYTVDIGCGNYLLDYSFADTKCFDWLAENNYENAKRFGFIPSYPENSGKQGPEPEPWEYVWVGEEVLLAAPYQDKE